FFGGEVVTADIAGTRTKVEPWNHPFGKVNQTDNSGNQRANYRTAGLADMTHALEPGRPARCGRDLALHAGGVIASVLKAGETGSVVELTTTCARPAALGPDEARALLR